MTDRAYALRVTNGPSAGHSVSVSAEVVLGRSDACDLVVDDRRASRRHLRVFLEDNTLHFEDLGSQHGTKLNGLATLRSRLSPGDTLEFGDTVVRVETQDSEDTAPIDVLPDSEHLTAQLIKRVKPEQTPNLGTRNFGILYAITRAIQAQRDLKTMLAQVLDQLLDATRCDRGFVAIIAADETIVPKCVRFRDQALSAFESEKVVISSTVANQVLGRRCAMISVDTGRDDRFVTSDTILHSDICGLLAVPILLGDRVLGLIELERFGTEFSLAESDLDLVSVVASTLGVAIDNLELAQLREAAIADLTRAQAELLAAREQLIQAEQLAAIGRLGAGIAHEIKNHLSPFMLADMIAQRYGDDQEIQEAAEMMLEAQKQIYGLVDEIRLFAKGSKSDYSVGPADLKELVQGVERFLSCDATVKRVRLRVEIAADPLVQIDAPRIRQVLINLIRNAAQASQDSSEVLVRTLENDRFGIVEVVDHGTGIPPEIQPKVFEPLFSTKGEAGLGLGLDISRRIVEDHGGTLDFQDNDGAGTTFRMALPLC